PHRHAPALLQRARRPARVRARRDGRGRSRDRRRPLGARRRRRPARQRSAREPRRRRSDRGGSRRGAAAERRRAADHPVRPLLPARAQRRRDDARQPCPDRRERRPRRRRRRRPRRLVSLYDAVRDLPLVVDSYALEGLAAEIASGWTRKTTVVHLHGRGEEGVGEDVTYHGEEHDALQARGPALPLAGEWTLDAFSSHLGGLALFDGEPAQHAYLDYRRWAFESAALDLALRQAGTSLGRAVGRE